MNKFELQKGMTYEQQDMLDNLVDWANDLYHEPIQIDDVRFAGEILGIEIPKCFSGFVYANRKAICQTGYNSEIRATLDKIRDMLKEDE